MRNVQRVCDNNQQQDDEKNVDFLLRVRESYKYLGIHQLVQDLSVNKNLVEEKMLQQTQKILNSNLSISQKIKLLNTMVIPAVIYVVSNFSSQKRKKQFY